MDPHHGPSQPDLLIGQTIGNYLVTQKLGEGGMGSVYLAEHPSIGKKVALKILHSEFSSNQEVAARFFNEAKAVNDIGHPNIVDIHDFGIIQSGLGREQLVYFIMEYLAGNTLSQLIRAEAPLPPERALTIALQVADALSASHKCGIVHRDLKPDNIILLQRGRERDFVKLLDFGIAKLVGNANGSHRTRTGLVMGTPAYMSPEQCEGRATVDLRTDVYALGIVLYEMLTGRVPFIGEGYGEILVQHLTQMPVPPSQFRMLPAHVEVVVMKALEKRPDMRYPTMDEFMRAMADPVGYVEAHGGVQGFMQRQLMPSSAPLPPVRLTPAPLTPPPGTLSPVYATPAPTTLGAAAGQVTGGRSRTGFLIAAGLVVIAAGVGIALVLNKGGTGEAAGSGSGTAIASGSEIGSGSETDPHAVTPGSDGSATKPAGSGSGSDNAFIPADSGTTATVSPPTIPDAGPIVVEPTTEIQVTSSPSGAHILVDGLDIEKVTPATLTFPKKQGKRITIVLRLKGFKDHTFKPVELADNASEKAELVKVKSTPPITHDNNGSGSVKNGSGGHTTPPQGSNSDPDGLMHP